MSTLPTFQSATMPKPMEKIREISMQKPSVTPAFNSTIDRLKLAVYSLLCRILWEEAHGKPYLKRNTGAGIEPLTSAAKGFRLFKREGQIQRETRQHNLKAWILAIQLTLQNQPKPVYRKHGIQSVLQGRGG